MQVDLLAMDGVSTRAQKRRRATLELVEAITGRVVELDGPKSLIF